MMFRTRRWPVALATLMFVAACTGTSPTTAPTTAPPAASTPPAASGTPGRAAALPAARARPPAAAPASPPAGSETPGASATHPWRRVPDGHLVFAEWQPADQLNPFFTTAFTNFESLAPALRSLLTINEEGAWTADLATEVPSVDSGALVPNADAPGRLHDD